MTERHLYINAIIITSQRPAAVWEKERIPCSTASIQIIELGTSQLLKDFYDLPLQILRFSQDNADLQWFVENYKIIIFRLMRRKSAKGKYGVYRRFIIANTENAENFCLKKSKPRPTFCAWRFDERRRRSLAKAVKFRILKIRAPRSAYAAGNCRNYHGRLSALEKAWFGWRKTPSGRICRYLRMLLKRLTLFDHKPFETFKQNERALTGKKLDRVSTARRARRRLARRPIICCGSTHQRQTIF